MGHTVLFGEIEQMAWWTVRGSIPKEKLVPLAQTLSDLMGMTLDGDPDIRSYRNDDHRDGKGGVGEQGYFAWIESWLMIGTWPERNKIRIAMSTCAIERFSPHKITQFLKQEIGEILVYGDTPW